jgi:hypothetical protein
VIALARARHCGAGPEARYGNIPSTDAWASADLGLRLVYMNPNGFSRATSPIDGSATGTGTDHRQLCLVVLEQSQRSSRSLPFWHSTSAQPSGIPAL